MCLVYRIYNFFFLTLTRGLKLPIPVIIPCQVTQVFQMQLLVKQFTIHMFHIGFMQVLILWSLNFQYYKIFKTLKLSYLGLH